ncbi:OLC1v1024708C1 [Oldenlandia corymbosa var. corymbosa]|uniref:OLC1v1024708C1 n=1 Tax=Oldenlandia corymbosa var. corymbosa TaxID=529605 RepID=A0AAV1C388_OLDCO|nr:OLC1v1024708C1 [Oldenlandia corymbosa var. corymbosa]
MTEKVRDTSFQKRKANYKPSIWNYDFLLQSLTSKYSEEKYTTKAKKLKEDLSILFEDKNSDYRLSILRLVDSIRKLGLAKYFQEEIKGYLLKALLIIRFPEICSSTASVGEDDDLYVTALCFRLLRQFGYRAPQASSEIFQGFVNETGKFKTNTDFNEEELMELFEASNMGCEGENIMDEARFFCIQNLEAMDHVLPTQWTAEWFNLKKQISAYEKECDTRNHKLSELARLNFNIIQAAHQQDLKEILRWWMNLEIRKKLSFSRDRIVESFLYAGGVAYEPQHGSLRKCLTKVIKLVLVIDDLFDVYGSFEHLQCFTNSVNSWMPEEVVNLPECMQLCFWTLYNTTSEISVEIQKEKGWNSVLPHLQKAWGEFCESLLLEAKWDEEGYTPSLQEYLENGFISSSGPLVSLHIIFGVENPTSSKTLSEILLENKDIIYYTSLIIRLCNDQGTSTEERKRGEAPSSIFCCMSESNVTEDIAREHIKSIITMAWRKINGYHCMFGDEPIKHYLTNAARVAHFIYQHGDGFRVQDRERVLSNLIEPL